ncbi:U32 family peptidase [Butyrivibrio sp. X503]|uniref:peptidase U32 family protein n=1 Tax=Butyrivibrio sp. X503 TaxID=2364878 RepID=UPI000EA941B6|nr:U32 family peptidase [Butyrivibrio sp. X503]RKM57020.1 U32 family peptidase [Butyrivibrio sp. X503]
MNKVELLAPAGGYETMVGAFNAGADAIYLGGSKFGARAYADNFDRDQVLDAVSYAHLHGKKIYMTVNTLVKEREFGELYDFMLPYAEKNLDGVIVQDLGVMRFIRDEFPGIELHASTQQTVTGVYGARLLKELGCCRVVPARELSLEEMKAIREKADIEVEAFIHGAMCYCYSGACLFSSMVGTRSGNRGRCAQPCRLPYTSDVFSSKSKEEQYPLSLKDMCTIDMIPELIEAGIDSFKIEGRMKKPEYAAGVTALYRKYIDLYYAEPDKKHEVSKDDMEMLKSLYLRTGISSGYYHKHNGKEMVTISSPAYNGTKEEVLNKVKEQYLGKELKIKCDIFCKLKLSEKAELIMNVNRDGEFISKTVVGNEVQAASKRPMDEESAKKQLERLGNTPFEAESIEITIDDNNTGKGIFMPVSELNELRRKLCEEMEEELLRGYGKSASYNKNNTYGNNEPDDKRACEVGVSGKDTDVHVLVHTKAQLEALKDILVKIKYGDITEGRANTVSRVYLESDLLLNSDILAILKATAFSKVEVIAALPYVTREESFDGSCDISFMADGFDGTIDGLLVRNLEQLGLLKGKDYKKKVILDYGVYTWNAEAASLLSELKRSDESSFVSEIAVPYELTIHEASETVRKVKAQTGFPVSYNVYGHVPMMISAGCIKKTLDKCSGFFHENHHEKMLLTDRMGNKMPVTTNCRNCYNIIWNANPTALFNKMDDLYDKRLFDHFRIDLTVEDKETALDILRVGICSGDKEHRRSLMQRNQNRFTTGHYKRGVE